METRKTFDRKIGESLLNREEGGKKMRRGSAKTGD
jgi:hypothetical protein